jgi:hypothetical protein
VGEKAGPNRLRKADLQQKAAPSAIQRVLPSFLTPSSPGQHTRKKKSKFKPGNTHTQSLLLKATKDVSNFFPRVFAF